MLQKLNLVATGRVAPLLVLLAFASLGVWAQSTQGGLHGAVTDASGAAVPNAKVTLTNEGTNEARTSVTNGAGFYDFSNVVPATYTVVAETPSFKKFERKNIIVGTQEFVTVDIRLEVGAVTESVLVTEQMPLIESSNASQGQVLDNQKLVELPNLGRNPFMMSKLASNVVQAGNPAYNRMEDQSGSSTISIAGGPVRGNNYLLDGIPITDAANRAIIIPTIEAVQEVKIQANTYDAEMARTGGGMFNTLMKSGANEFHGSAYGHIRSTSWDANNFFSNASATPIVDQPNKTWGASLGGRIWIPHVYDGKNKTFFFLGMEHYDDAQGNSQTFQLPTALERAGNFTKSAGVQVYDPTTLAPISIIPASKITPVGFALANSFGTPTSAPTTFGGTDYTAATELKARAVQYTAKIDEDFTSWWRASLSYLRYYSLEPGNTFFNSDSTPDGWRLLRRVDATAINNIITVNPTTVLALRYGFNRFPNFQYNTSQGFNVASLGFSPNFAKLVSGPAAEYPCIIMTNFGAPGYTCALGDQSDWDYYDEASHNFSTSVDKYLGRHSIKAGFDYRKLATSGSGLNCPTGCYTFNSNTNSRGVPIAGPGGNSNSGVDLADLLMGLPYERQADTASTLTDKIPYYGWYVQDNFRVNSKLTVNMGLRWEHEGGVQEAHNGLIVNFNTTAATPLPAAVTGISPKGEAIYAGLNGAPTSAGNYNSNKWGPRGGAAYQLNSKTVLRGGYGIFWAPQIALGGPIATPGYSNNTDTQAYSTTDVLTNPFPSGLQAPVGNSLGTSTGIGNGFSLISPSAKSPMVQQYSVDVQRQLAGGIALEVGYVGSHSTNLTLGAPNININALNPSFLSQSTAALNASVANPFYGVIKAGTLSSPTVPAFRLLLPYSAFGAITEQFGSQNHAAYNSMIVKGEKRFSHGLSFLSTLTWSTNKDESSGGVTSNLNGGAQNAPQNPYNMAAEYSYATVDTPIRLALAFSYELPFGKGRTYMSNINKALDWAVGGWVVNGVAIYQTGFPLQIYQGNNLNGSYGYGAQRPNMTSVSPGTSGSVEQRLGGTYSSTPYINVAAFTAAAQGTFGNTPRTLGSLRGPGQKNWDMSIFKNFGITEKFKAQFRAEALNAFNSPLFRSPDTNISDGSAFGQITSQANFSRQLQLALRFSF